MDEVHYHKSKIKCNGNRKNNTKSYCQFFKEFFVNYFKPITDKLFQKSHVIRAVCEDYRAGISVDLEHDQKNKKEGQRIKCPLLVLWASNGFASDFSDPLTIWKNWAEHVKCYEVS